MAGTPKPRFGTAGETEAALVPATPAAAHADVVGQSLMRTWVAAAHAGTQPWDRMSARRDDQDRRTLIQNHTGPAFAPLVTRQPWLSGINELRADAEFTSTTANLVARSISPATPSSTRTLGRFYPEWDTAANTCVAILVPKPGATLMTRLFTTLLASCPLAVRISAVAGDLMTSGSTALEARISTTPLSASSNSPTKVST